MADKDEAAEAATEETVLGNGAYNPSPEERAENRRHSALHFATGLRSPGAHDIARVLDDARQIDAFLAGNAD